MLSALKRFLRGTCEHLWLPIQDAFSSHARKCVRCGTVSYPYRTPDGTVCWIDND